MRFNLRTTRTRRVTKQTLVALVIVALSGALYEQFGAWNDRRRFPQIGRSVDIGGRSLNIYCAGEGNPTVVLLRGGFSWILVQPDVSRVTRACWYDPAGMGWSEPSSGTHSSFSIASDLHRLLQRANVSPPYVLVGHSVGGFDARAFYRLYPDEVAGIVLVDASHEDYNARIQVGNPLCPRCPRRPAVFVARVLGTVGLFRLFASQPGPAPDGMTPQEWATIASLQRQYTRIAAGLRQDPRVNEEQMRTDRNLGRVPLVVLTGGRTFASSDPREAQEFARAQRTWIEMQAELARLSTRGRHVIVEKSGHMMPYETPEAVIGAVLDIVAEVRNGSQPASSSGKK